MAFAQQILPTINLSIHSRVHSKTVSKAEGKFSFIPAECTRFMSQGKDARGSESHAILKTVSYFSPRFALWKPAPTPFPKTMTPFP